MPLEASLTDYILHRDKNFFIGMFLIPVTSLKIDPTLQRPLDEEHLGNIESMYIDGADPRVEKALECIVPQESKNQVADWVEKQDPAKFRMLTPADLLRLDLPELTFPILKGQHRYQVYCSALEQGLIPQDVLHLDCLCVRLFYLGVSSDHRALT